MFGLLPGVLFGVLRLLVTEAAARRGWWCLNLVFWYLR